MSNKTKIALYSGEIPSTTFIERLIKGLANAEYEIYLFGALNKSVPYPIRIQNFGYRTSKIRKAFYLVKYTILLALFKSKDKQHLDKILQEKSRNGLYDRVKYYPVLWHKPDVFHIQWAKGLDQWMWVKEFGIKLVLGLRGAHINYSPIADLKLSEMYKRNFPKVDAFHAVSAKIGREGERYNASEDKIQVVKSGLDLSQFEFNPSNKQQKLKIISVGRPHWVKGYTLAIDACKLLQDHQLNFSYTIVGGFNLELKYQVHELELNNHVEFIEHLPFKQVKALIQSSDVLVLSSHAEGIANVVLEAMALGTLVLTTNCGGMEEVVNNGVNGFVVPIRDSEEMAQKLIEIDQMPDKDRHQMLKAARKLIEMEHSEKKMIGEMISFYEQL